eukprot:scaffold89447_cov20-Tisochrysis_lutea.AAC.1
MHDGWTPAQALALFAQAAVSAELFPDDRPFCSSSLGDLGSSDEGSPPSPGEVGVDGAGGGATGGQGAQGQQQQEQQGGGGVSRPTTDTALDSGPCVRMTNGCKYVDVGE